MRRALGALLAAVVLFGATQASAQTTTEPANADAAVQQPAITYSAALPQEIPGIGFETQKQVFLDLLAVKGLTYATNSTADIFGVSPPEAPFRTAVYFFNSNACTCLTEVELRFNDDAQAKAYFDAKFPSRTVGGDYIHHDGASAYRAKAWRFQSKVYVVATIPNTRWANQ